MQENERDQGQPVKNERDENANQFIPGANEKTSLGGEFNSGVTSHDPEERNEIEKKGSMAFTDPNGITTTEPGLTKDDLPDSSNKSTGKMGSGQRQDSN